MISEPTIKHQTHFQLQLPYPAAMFHDHLLICNGALLSKNYVITTTECYKKLISSSYHAKLFTQKFWNYKMKQIEIDHTDHVGPSDVAKIEESLFGMAIIKLKTVYEGLTTVCQPKATVYLRKPGIFTHSRLSLTGNISASTLWTLKYFNASRLLEKSQIFARRIHERGYNKSQLTRTSQFSSHKL